MSNLLIPNQTVQSLSGHPCTVTEFIAGGTQGEVFKARWLDNDYALKWYFQQNATEQQKAALELLIKDGSPSDTFLWPLDLTFAPGVPGFGYLMRLRENRFKKLTELVAGQIDPSFLVLISAGIELSKAFRSLHNKGLCYKDISLQNAFLDVDNGDVLVCDNDNVTVNGSTIGGVIGTPDFMAPEIVRNEAVPTNKTDLYSLSVLIFYLFYIHHPLCGKRILRIKCWDLPARELLFGNDPVFIFDPDNLVNAAVADHIIDPAGEAGANAIRYWGIYPSAFNRTVLKAFTTGLNDPDSRVTALEWLTALASLRDSIYRCSCGTPNFYDGELTGASRSNSQKCWSCGRDAKFPYRIRVGKSVVMLNADTKLYPHHMNDGRAFDYSIPVAEVVRHPTNPALWGLKNLSKVKWVVTLPDGALRDAEAGQSAPLVANVRIDFGRIHGEIRY